MNEVKILVKQELSDLEKEINDYLSKDWWIFGDIKITNNLDYFIIVQRIKQ